MRLACSWPVRTLVGDGCGWRYTASCMTSGGPPPASSSALGLTGPESEPLPEICSPVAAGALVAVRRVGTAQRIGRAVGKGGRNGEQGGRQAEGKDGLHRCFLMA